MRVSKIVGKVIILILVIGVCSPGFTAEKEFAGVTIRVANQASQWADVFKTFAPEFEKITGAKMEFEDISFGVMYEKLKTTFIGEIAKYDMIWYDSMWTPEFSKRGWLKNLESLLANPDLAPADFGYPYDFFGTEYSGAYSPNNRWNLPAGIWGIPWIAGFRPLYYRTDLVAEAGFVDPFREAKPPDTLDELLLYARKLNTPAEEIYGFVMPAKRPRICYDWSGYLWTYGGDFFDRDFKPVFNNPAGVKALELYIELGKVAPPGAAAYHITEAWTAFMQGRAALAWTWQDLASVARKQSEIIGKFECAPPPVYAGKRRPLVGGIVASIPTQAKNPEAAFKFITWALAPERAKIATLKGATVQRKSTWDDPEVETMYPSGEGDIEKLCIETGRTVPLIPEWATVDQIIAEELSAAFTGAKSAKKALDDAAKKVEKFMEEAGYYE